ncbi:helix-turn-helix domain-containing protein [Streptomyces sp. adm13(2018)]|uniref:helix-turn-helix domain-containing protein n=1 Tax=Streptomyces sp. adm13(2018) TaxID=2479007 RepID=UPI0011CD7A28|nr:helix-turn-helix domain-containing protein [Streptomyces sp. adm13(2018)]TXS04657.1 helix-turn-helix domain-containing protein [Streptomyces sp. adm13(2018)]
MHTLSPASAPGPLIRTRHAAETVPAAHRRGHWREALSRTFGAVDMAIPEEVRSGTIRTAALGRVQAVTVESEPQFAHRTKRLIACADDEDLVVVKLLSRGGARVEQDARDNVVLPGQLFVYDMARPIRLALPEPFQTKSLVLPRAVLGLDESDVSRITALPVGSESAVGGILAPLLSQLVDTAETCPEPVGELIARNVIDLLTVLADEQRGADTTESPSGARVLLTRIRAFIDAHLTDPDLTPELVARAHHVSVRYLHKLFEGEGVTVSRWIQRRRLEECRRTLARRDATDTTIAGVAHRWGFTSASHFSRVFRAAYGQSPIDWRNSAADGWSARSRPAEPYQSALGQAV